MGSHNGPKISGSRNMLLNIDAFNFASYSGAGNTINSLITNEKLSGAGVTFISSKGESSFSFGGAGIVTSASNTGISGNTDRTLSCWVKFSSKNSQSVMSFGANGVGTGYGIETTATVWQFNFGSVGSATTITYNSNQWYQVSCVGQNAGGNNHNFSLYINGRFQASVGFTFINTTNSTLRLGTNPAANLRLNGLISQARIYNKALDAKELLSNFNNFKSRYGY